MEYMQTGDGFPKLSASAVTLGKFDGIHRGHQKLIRKILEQKEAGYQTVLCAFVGDGKTILSGPERKHFLETLGVDLLLECPLDEKLLHMKAESFVREILVGDLKTAYVAVGEDFRFGYERKGTPRLLKALGEELGFHTEILSKELEGKRKISSTYIREELARGNMEQVEKLLGRPFLLEGQVVHGRGMGHREFFPTANLIPPAKKLMPPNGVYVTRSHFASKTFEGITNIGYKPTVGEKFLGAETYLFDCAEDLYGMDCFIEFLRYQRPERKFTSYEALKKQIQADVENGLEFFQKSL